MYEHDNSVRDNIMRVSEKVDHQGIGGKEIILEFGLSKEEVLDMAVSGNWACSNFMDRRDDFDYTFDKLLYYGKVDGLGYIVAEDELEAVI